MTEQEFLAMMDEILDTGEPVKPEAVLDEIEEWDSLSAVMFQSAIFKRTKRFSGQAFGLSHRVE